MKDQRNDGGLEDLGDLENMEGQIYLGNMGDFRVLGDLG